MTKMSQILKTLNRDGTPLSAATTGLMSCGLKPLLKILLSCHLFLCYQVI